MNAIVRLSGLALAAAVAAAPAQAQNKVLLRFSTAAPPPDFLSKSLERFKEEVDKAAPNQFDVRLHPGSSLFRQGTEVAAIQRGNLEMSTMTTFEVAQQIAEWGFLNRAFLFRDWDHVTKVMNGPIGERYRKDVAEKMGIVILGADLSRHAPAQSARQARREVAGRPQGRQAAHGGRAGVAAARQVARRHADADGDAGGVSRRSRPARSTARRTRSPS